MKKVKNPYPADEYKCFACSPSNPIGLKLKFEQDNDSLWGIWDPGENYQGYHNVVHGGIIATLLDEVGAWYVSVKMGTAGVTKNLDIEYLKPLYINRGPVKISAKLKSREDNLANLHCELFDSTGQLCSSSESVFFLYPEEIAKRRFLYPGMEAFG